MNARNIIISAAAAVNAEVLFHTGINFIGNAAIQCKPGIEGFLKRNQHIGASDQIVGDKKFVIILSEELFEYNEQCTLAYFWHELAHIKLGHLDGTGSGLVINEKMEIEADDFARAQMPEFNKFFIESVVEAFGGDVEDPDYKDACAKMYKAHPKRTALIGF